MDKNTQFNRMFNAEMILVKANNCKYKYDTEQKIKKRNTIKCHQTDVEQKKHRAKPHTFIETLTRRAHTRMKKKVYETQATQAN